MIYEYECDNCNNIQDEIHGMNETPDIKCEKCGHIMHRIISGGSGFVFKGGAPSADMNFKKSMINKSEKAGRKARDHVKPVNTLGDL